MTLVKKMILSALLLYLIAGCTTRLQEPPMPVQPEYSLKPEPHYKVDTEPYGRYSRQTVMEDKPDPQAKAVEKRFVQADQSNSAVETALMWSQRYDDLSRKTEELRERNNQLQTENADMKMRISRLQVELDQANRELADANAFLEQLQLELTQWKKDVLGFREEIRSSQAAQLRALTKILKVLGAEVSDPVQQDMSQPVNSKD